MREALTHSGWDEMMALAFRWMGGDIELYWDGNMNLICNGVLDEGSEMLDDGWDFLA